MDPLEKLGIVRAEGSAVGRDAAYACMQAGHAGDHLFGTASWPVHRHHCGVSGTLQSVERALPKACVLPHAAAHPRLGQLQDHCSDAADVQPERILEDLPGHRVRCEQRGLAARLKEVLIRAAVGPDEMREARFELGSKPPGDRQPDTRGIHVRRRECSTLGTRYPCPPTIRRFRIPLTSQRDRGR